MADTVRGARMGDRICSVEGCDRKHFGRGYCQLHYIRVRNHGSPGATRKRREPSPCKIEGCGGTANVPGSARGWCAPHYQRWQRWGDPLGSHIPTVGVASCSVDGCDDVVKARDWCVRHYTRWARCGDPLTRLRGEVVAGCRICPRCSEDKPIEAFGRGRSYCLPCSAARTAEYRVENPYVPRGDQADCQLCGQAFLANKRRYRYCSPECSAARKNPDNWKHYNARKARLRAALVESFDRVEIFERDGWTCQICLTPVDRSAKFPSPASVSLDHIIPIARGGKHSRANSQTACLGCNVRKGVRMS